VACGGGSKPKKNCGHLACEADLSRFVLVPTPALGLSFKASPLKGYE
jgi:hypothetical protein